MASGMNGQGFAFHGYLPVKADARTAAIQRLEADSRRTGYAQIFIETPYRNGALLAALAATCKPATRLCVAADLTLPTESVVSQRDRRMARRRRRALREAAGDLRAAGLRRLTPDAVRLPLRRRVLDVALQHLVLEALLLVDRLRHVVERHDAEQRACRPSPARSARGARASSAAAP